MPNLMTFQTYNPQNLFVYHRLRKNGIDLRFKEKRVSITDLGYKDIGARRTAFETGFWVEEKQRRITAKSMVDSPAPHNLPHIIALQEIEGLETLRKFRSEFLHKLTINGNRVRFPYAMSIDGNDSLLIDVGLLSRVPVDKIRTHMFAMRQNGNRPTPIFPRDCLEVDFLVGDGNKQTLTLFINHFTSQLSDDGEKRELQAKEVVRIIKERFGSDLKGGDFIVVGDLNAKPTSPELAALYDPSLGLHDVLTKVPQVERWTHFYYDDKGKPLELSQLDHFLVSPSLWEKNNQGRDVVVTIEKRGLLQTIRHWSEDKTGPLPEPFKGVTVAPGTEGSDHCPVYVSLQV